MCVHALRLAIALSVALGAFCSSATHTLAHAVEPAHAHAHDDGTVHAHEHEPVGHHSEPQLRDADHEPRMTVAAPRSVAPRRAVVSSFSRAASLRKASITATCSDPDPPPSSPQRLPTPASAGRAPPR